MTIVFNNIGITNIKQGLQVKCDIGLDTVVGQCPTRIKYLNFFYSTQSMINILITFLTWYFQKNKKWYCDENFSLQPKAPRFDYFQILFFVHGWNGCKKKIWHFFQVNASRKKEFSWEKKRLNDNLNHVTSGITFLRRKRATSSKEQVFKCLKRKYIK